MAGKTLSTEPAVDATASVRDCRLGAYTEVGARTILLEVAMADYSYVVNDSQVTYTTIGKFCSIAAMTRINPGNQTEFAYCRVGDLRDNRQFLFDRRNDTDQSRQSPDAPGLA